MSEPANKKQEEKALKIRDFSSWFSDGERIEFCNKKEYMIFKSGYIQDALVYPEYLGGDPNPKYYTHVCFFQDESSVVFCLDSNGKNVPGGNGTQPTHDFIGFVSN